MAAKTLATIFEGRRSQPQELIEVLHDVQDSFGYISKPAMETASAELGVPLIEVYRVANFYEAFSLVPRGKHVITVCTGTACHVRGAGLLFQEVLGQLDVAAGETTDDGLFTVECVNCLGACALGPVVVVDDVYHHRMTPAKLRKLIQSVRATEGEDSTHAAM